MVNDENSRSDSRRSGSHGSLEHDWVGRFRLHAQRRGLADPELDRREWLARAKVFLRLERGVLLRNHQHGMSGVSLARWRAAVIDVFLEQVFQRLLHGAPPEEREAVAFIAHGGYGRGELCPFSDVDVMFIYDETRLHAAALAALQERVSGTVVSFLWDAGLRPGHATRTLSQSIADARADAVTRNTLLDARRVAGNPALVANLRRATFDALRQDGIADAVAFLIAARERRHADAGGTVFMQEPNIKNGVGGLRDHHTLHWFARLHGGADADARALATLGFLTPAEVAAATRAYSHLLRLRNELHFQSRREADVLGLEKQKTVAEALGCAGANWMRQIETLMHGYYKAADTIHQTLGEVEWRFRELLENGDLAAPRNNRNSGGGGNNANRNGGNAVVVGGAGAAESAAGVPPVFRAADAEATAICATAAPSFAPADSSAPDDIPFHDGFLLRRGRLIHAHPDIFRDAPARLMRVFRILQEYNVPPARPLLRLVRENARRLDRKTAASREVIDCFLAILADAGRVAPALSLMLETGVLTRFIPEFTGLRWLVQREIYHRYTVDIHTLRCLRELDEIFRPAPGPLRQRYRDALLETGEPALPYLALLLHDIGKRHGVSRHAETGAADTAKILRRLRLPPAARDEITALVRDHLAMSAFWQRNDLDDPANLAAFAATIGTARHLHYLYALTYCDARGTSPDLWNDYKNALHRQLYHGALARLDHHNDPATLRLIRENIERHLAGEIPAEEVDAHFRACPPRYFEQYGEADILLHIRLVNRKLRTLTSATGDGGLSPTIHHAPAPRAPGVTTVTLVTWDREGLFYRFAGAFAVAGLSILRARGFVRADRIAIDTFQVTPAADTPVAAAPDAPATAAAPVADALAAFAQAAEEALVHRRELEPDVRRRAAAAFAALPPDTRKILASLPSRPRVTTHFDPVQHRTTITVSAPDRVGLLFFLARILSRHRLNIAFAGINTEACLATDTFYLEAFPGDPDPTPARLSALVHDIETELPAA